MAVVRAPGVGADASGSFLLPSVPCSTPELTPFHEEPDFTLYCGDVLDTLRALPDESVHMCVTSPPYFQQRNYGVEGQIGQENTPDEYVQRLVEVFREVRRVLRDDGTLWLNLGDSYAGSWGNQGRKPERGTQRDINGPMMTKVHDGRYPSKGSNTGKVPNGFKQKDLIGIPWSVAKALQEPYYNGRIKDERDRIWLSAMVEAEGCMFIHRRKAGDSSYAKYTKKDGTEVNYARTKDTFSSGLEVASTDRILVERCREIVGKGSIGQQEKGRNRTLYRWMLRSNECRDVIAELYPHMVAKQHEARLLIGCPSSGEDARKAWVSLKALHQGAAATIDFDPPEPKWKRGWFLRSDIIWSKPQPNARERPRPPHEGARVHLPASEVAALLL